MSTITEKSGCTIKIEPDISIYMISLWVFKNLIYLGVAPNIILFQMLRLNIKIIK